MKQFGPTPQLLVIQASSASPVEAHLQLVADSLKETVAWKNHTWGEAPLEHPDITLFNQDGAGIKIEQVRLLLGNVVYPPYQAVERVVVLFQLDQASAPAQQALLKFLEEPPSYLRVIATTHQLTAVLPTIQSRCQISFTSIENVGSSPNPSTHTELIDQLLTGKLSYAESIKVAEAYPDRPQATSFLSELLSQLHSSSWYPSSRAVKAGQIISESWSKLHQNTNVRLALENCLFSIKNAIANPG
jgi:hypothetical protein